MANTADSPNLRSRVAPLAAAASARAPNKAKPENSRTREPPQDHHGGMVPTERSASSLSDPESGM